MECHVYTDSSSIPDSAIGGWARLADETRQSFGHPAWLLPYWNRTKQPPAFLRILIAEESDQVKAVVPLFGERTAVGIRYRFLGANVSPTVDVVAHHDDADRIAPFLATALASLEPAAHALLFDGTSSESPWPRLLERNWVGGAKANVAYDMPCPTVNIAGLTFDQWFASKSRNFRQKMRQQMRRLDERGITFSRVDSEHDWGTQIEQFAQLHRSNWKERGGSGVVVSGVPDMLIDAAKELAPLGQMFIHRLDLGHRPVGIAVFLRSGPELTYWLGGFDDEFAEFQPGIMVLFDAIRQAFDQGGLRFGLGPGAQQYKLRFSDATTRVEWWTLAPASALSRLQVVHYLSDVVRTRAAESLSPGAKRRLKRLNSAVRSFGLSSRE